MITDMPTFRRELLADVFRAHSNTNGEQKFKKIRVSRGGVETMCFTGEGWKRMFFGNRKIEEILNEMA